MTVMKYDNVESRAFTCDVRSRTDEKHGNVIEGIPIVFDADTDMGFFTETISKDALASTDMKDVRFLVNHDTSQLPLARSRNNNENSTMQMTVEDDGLHVRVDLDTENNARARELLSAVNREDCSGMSFMFTVDKDSWEGLDTDMPKRTIESIGRIFEVSAVTFPAYEQTSINARSLDSARASLDSAREALDSAKKLETVRTELKERLKVYE